MSVTNSGECAEHGEHASDDEEWRASLARLTEGVCPQCHIFAGHGPCPCCGLTYRLAQTAEALTVTILFPFAVGATNNGSSIPEASDG